MSDDNRTSLPMVDDPPSPSPPSASPLLVLGNTKLGETVFHFDLPAPFSCPGRSDACSDACYAIRLYQWHPNVLARHQRNLDALGDLDAFRRRLLREIRRRGVRLLRWHVAGDVFGVGYARTLLRVMQATPRVEHWLYTRSWRVRRLRPFLEQMALLPNVSVWYSCDATTGMPRAVPPRVRLAWMATSLGERQTHAARIARCHLAFTDLALRRLGLSGFGGVRVCPQENNALITCATCRFCLPGEAT